MEELIRQRIQESIETKEKLLSNTGMIRKIDCIADLIVRAIVEEKKLLICGNGGSASDALHIAGELVGRFACERKGWAAIALNADVATMTAIANDYGYDEIFARQVEALMKTGDILLGISTSGNSENVVKAFKKAKALGGTTVLLAGKDGGKLNFMADVSIVVPSLTTARVQESHILIYHILCELVEDKLVTRNG